MKLTAFDRGAIVAEMRLIFEPLEAHLKPGDSFDYDHLFIGSGFINETWEQVIIIPLTEDSLSAQQAMALGDATLWKDIAPLPSHGFYALPPNECFRDTEADVPYLVRATGWGTAETIDADGNFVRTNEIHWSRPVGHEKSYFRMSGNIVVKAPWCSSVSSNQA